MRTPEGQIQQILITREEIDWAMERVAEVLG